MAFPTKKVGLRKVVQAANQATLHNPSNPPSGTEATEVHCTQVEKSRQEDPGERNNAAPNFPERVPQETEVERLAETPQSTPQRPTRSCGRNDEIPNCGTHPEEYVRNRLELDKRLLQKELHEMQDWLDILKTSERRRIQDNLQPQTYTLPETGEQFTRQDVIDDLEDRINALKQHLLFLQEKERSLVSVQALIRSETSRYANLEPQAPSGPGHSTDDEEADGEDYSEQDPDEDRIPTFDDEAEMSNVSITTRSHAYRTLKSSAQYQDSLSNQKWEDPLNLFGQEVHLPPCMLPKEQDRDAEMFIHAKTGCDEKEERRCRDHSVVMDLPEWYSRPTRLVRAGKRKIGSSLSAPSKGKKRIRKTEAQLLPLSTQEVGLGEVLQVAPVTLQDRTNPPSGTEATAGAQTNLECGGNNIQSPERSPIVERFAWYHKQLKRSEQATEMFSEMIREYHETMQRHRKGSSNEIRKPSDRDSHFNDHARPNIETPTTIHPPNLVNKQSPMDNLSEVLPTRSLPRELDAPAKQPTSEGLAHGSVPVFTLIPPYILDQKKGTVSNVPAAAQAETSLSSQPQKTPSVSSYVPANDTHTFLGESNIDVHEESNDPVCKTDPKPLHHSQLGTLPRSIQWFSTDILHRSSPQTCQEIHSGHTPHLIASTERDLYCWASTARPAQNTVMKPATLELAGKRSKTISNTTSNAIATGREIVANMLSRTPRIADNNLFKDSIKKMQQVCQYLKYRLASKKAAHTDSLSDSVSRGRDTHEEGGEDVCTAGTTDDPGENPRRDSHEEGGGSPNGHSVERKSLDSFQVASPDQETHEEGGVHDTTQSEPGKDTHEEGGEPPADPQSPASTHATVRSSSDSPRKAEPEDDPLEEAGDQSGIPRNQNSFMQSSHAPPNRDIHEEVGETPAPTITSKKGSQRTTFSVDESMFRASRKSKMKARCRTWAKLLRVEVLKLGNSIESPGKGKRPATRWKHRKLRKFWKIVMEEDDLKTPKLLNGYGNNRPPEYGEPTDHHGPPKSCVSRKMKNVRMSQPSSAQPCNNTEDHALSQKPNVIPLSSVATETCGSRAERFTKKRHKAKRYHMKRVDQSNAKLQHVPRPACVIQASRPIGKIRTSVNSKSLICWMQTLPNAAENFLPPEDYEKKRLDEDAETFDRSSSVDFNRPLHHACDALTRLRRSHRTTAGGSFGPAHIANEQRDERTSYQQERRFYG